MAYLMAAGFLITLALTVLLVANWAIRLGLRAGWRPLACVLAGTAALLALTAGGVGWIILSTGHTPWLTWQAEFSRSLAASLEVYRRLGWDEVELQRTARLVRILFVDAAGGWLVLAETGIAFVSYLAQRRLAPHLPGSQIGLRPFSAWVVPEHTVWFLLGALGLIAAGGRLPAWSTQVTWNALVLLGSIYFLGGAAVTVYLLQKRKVPRAFQIIFLFLVGLLPMLIGLVILVGIFDTWWDWRRIKTLR
jgi:hypothetical protein